MKLHCVLAVSALLGLSISAQAAPKDNSSNGNSAEAHAAQEAKKAEQDAKKAEHEAQKAEQAQTKELSGKESPIQSPAQPYGLDIAAPVQLAGSDEASAKFQKEVLPGMLKLVDKSLEEYSYKTDKQLEAMAYDPSKLLLSVDSSARVYFIGEGAGYLNTLGISTTGATPLSDDAAMIFPNASSSVGPVASGKNSRSEEEPLLPGDFVDLGTFKAGTQLDFFLIAQGALGGKEFYSTTKSLNEDGLVHVVSLAYPGSPYLIIGFEDLRGGGDRDYNDIVFAIDIGVDNIKKLTGLGAPEPSLAAGSLFAAVALLGFSRRRK